MKQLEQAILSFTDWSQPWKFQESIANNANLNEAERTHFLLLWQVANNAENWGDDLILCCKYSHNSLRMVSNIDDSALGAIVRAASYQWYK